MCIAVYTAMLDFERYSIAWLISFYSGKIYALANGKHKFEVIVFTRLVTTAELVSKPRHGTTIMCILQWHPNDSNVILWHKILKHLPKNTSYRNVLLFCWCAVWKWFGGI